MRNEQVVQSWVAGKAAAAGNLSTDGVSLWSYSLCIGDTMLSGTKRVYDFTARGEAGFVSQTTSCHVGLAKRFA